MNSIRACTSNPILDDIYFEPLLSAIRGSSCEFIENPYGNPGDRLIQLGFLDLFTRNNIFITKISRLNDGFRPHPRSDLLLFYGGGSVGNFYTASPSLRRKGRNIKQISKILLPQSAFNDKEDLSHFDLIFARENASYEIMKRMGTCRLAPDGALALCPRSVFGDIAEWSTPFPDDVGVYLREDSERPDYITERPASIRDPSKSSFEEFIMMPLRHNSIVTNRLHFAIWALCLCMRVKLLNNSYHKNLSIFETWLSREADLSNRSYLISFDQI